MGPDIMFEIFPVIFFLIFFVVIGMIVFTIIQRASQWHRNNRSPVLTVDATVVAKRMSVSHHHHNVGDHSSMHYSSSTFYYVTFQFQSGDRLELGVPSNEYGMMVEGDYGKLTFQGTRFLGFNRQYIQKT